MIRVRLGCAALAALALAAAPARAARPHRGAEADALGARLTYDSDAFDYRPHPRLGWSVASLAGLGVRPRWTVVSGLRFIQIAEREIVSVQSSGGPGVRGTVRSWWSWVGLPVLARYRPWGAWPVYVEAGPELRYLSSATMSSDLAPPVIVAGPAAALRGARAAAIFEQAGVVGHDVDVTDWYRRWDVATLVGVGATHRLAGHRVGVHLRYGQGLFDLDKSGSVTRRAGALERGAGWTFSAPRAASSSCEAAALRGERRGRYLPIVSAAFLHGRKEPAR